MKIKPFCSGTLYTPYTFALFQIYIKNKRCKSYLQVITIRLSAVSVQQSGISVNEKPKAINYNMFLILKNINIS